MHPAGDWRLMETLNVTRNMRRRVIDTMNIFRATAVPYDLFRGQTLDYRELAIMLEEHGVKVPANAKQAANLIDTAISAFRYIERMFTESFNPDARFQVSVSDIPWLALLHGDWSGLEISHVVVDEAQDVNRVQAYGIARLLLVAQHPDGGRPSLLLVGDPFQAINGFRAAGKGELDYVISDICKVNGWQPEDLPVEACPLTVSMRCPQSHTALARKYAEVYSHEAAVEGVVNEPTSHFDVATIERGATVICRHNAPLTLLAISLLQEGRDVSFPGGEELGRAAAMLEELLGKAAMKYEGELVRIHVINALNQKIHDVEEIPSQERRRADSAEMERAKIAKALMEGLPERAVASDVASLLNRMSSESPAAIKLLSVHRAKGLEWDSIYLLDHDLHLADEAKLARMPVWLQAQERNCSFVATTRSRYAITMFTTEAWTRTQSAKKVALAVAKMAERKAILEPAVVEDDDMYQ